MSHPSWNAAPQPPSSPPHSPSQSELAKRIERFQEAAQDLLALYEPAAPSPDGVPHPAPSADGETRCYYLSPGAVRHERELTYLKICDFFVKGDSYPPPRAATIPTVWLFCAHWLALLAIYCRVLWSCPS